MNYISIEVIEKKMYDTGLKSLQNTTVTVKQSFIKKAMEIVCTNFY